MEQQFREESAFSSAPKRSYWKFVVLFLIIVGLVAGGFFVWDRYFSPEAKYARETQENYQKYLDFQANYEKALTEDVYGGKTPEETLNMFIEALKAGDVELASKYFYLDTNERSEYYLTQNEWRDGLMKVKEDEGLGEIIDIILGSALDSSSSSGDTKWFILKNKEGLVEYSIILKFNPYSGVWKIESI